MKLFLSLIIFVPISAFPISVSDLKTGDVLLQSVPCYVCSLIEIEEGAPYSHAGVVLVESNEISVMESWNNVEKLPLNQHLSYRKKKSETLVLRPVDEKGYEIQFDSKIISETFNVKYLGLTYDPAFLWNNFDENGEMLYCSEFVAKFLNEFLPRAIETKPMHFTHYRNDWIKYFHGTPPDGTPGLSPGDFVKSKLFKTLGTIEL